ncbi:MAG: hypothetical protein ACT4O6_09810 [Reyranella sp.]
MTAVKPPLDPRSEKLKIQTNEIVRRMFVATADGNYIVARLVQATNAGRGGESRSGMKIRRGETPGRVQFPPSAPIFHRAGGAIIWQAKACTWSAHPQLWSACADLSST